MGQYTETYRIKLSKETKLKLNGLKKYNIMPTRFIRQAIEEKLEKEIQRKRKLML
jgi:predicted DNA-binding protein